ncbi:hypothetical protein BDV93DRAFT_581297 [Ceratobasidium sp. AG-I]|nr:hypothetical protein BDV93DRAFT_581297 [Ceratobasidium sp. AG-I]
MRFGIELDPRVFTVCTKGARCLVCPGARSNGFLLSRNIQSHSDSQKHKDNLLHAFGSPVVPLNTLSTTCMNTSLPDLRDAADVLVSNGLVQDIALDEPFEPPPSQDEVCRTLVGHEGRNRAGEAAGGGWEDYEQEGEESEDDKVDSVGAEISSTEESEDEDESWSESGSGSESASEDEEHEDNGNGELGNREKPNSDTVLDMRQGAKRFGKRVRVEPKVGDPWYPFGSKGIQMAEMAFNSPRAKYSRMQQSGALSMVQELSGELVAPSLDALGKARKRMEAITGKSTHRETTSSGVVWYRNEISSSLANDMSNPITRCDMEFYPHLECNGQRMTQVWHGAKMLYDMPDHLLTPMMRASSNGTIYYVDELVKLSDGRFFIPRRWFLKGDSKARWCFGDIVTETAAGLIIERTSRALRTSVPVESISHAYSELLVSPDLFPGFAPGFEVDLELMPHPLRIVAGERDVYSVPLILFLDDVSGGVSKQWNKNIACYMSNATLPREQLQKEVNVCFVGSSKEATASELLLGISNSIKQEFLNPTVAFDALTMREALIRPYALMWPGDNPMQAEECSCGGLGSNFNCRTCGAGGTQEFKRTTEGYSSLFEVNSHATQTGVKDGISQPIVERLLALGVKLRTVVPGLPPMSPDKVLTHIGTDIHQDTPTEILHTVLLGVVKYFWAQTIHIVKQQHQMDLFRARLCSVDSAGLAIPPLAADYMCDYSGSLIGKHFKAIAQVMPFVIYDLVPQNVRDAWLLIGRLVVLLWDVEISNLDSYLAELKDVIDKFMLTTAACSPSIILLKPKFHFLVHLPRFIARFGPAILYSTERYESYHAVFRGTMIKSNRQAPSRDAAKAIASIRRVQHICRGGYWRNPDGSGWVQASPDVLQFVKRSTVFTKLLGIYVKPVPKPGEYILALFLLKANGHW